MNWKVILRDNPADVNVVEVELLVRREVLGHPLEEVDTVLASDVVRNDQEEKQDTEDCGEQEEIHVTESIDI